MLPCILPWTIEEEICAIYVCISVSLFVVIFLISLNAKMADTVVRTVDVKAMPKDHDTDEYCTVR